MKKLFCLMMTAALWAACDDDEKYGWIYTGEERLIVASDTRMGGAFVGVIPFLVTQRDGSTEWIRLSPSIKGLDYEYGFEYEVIVKRYQLNPEPGLQVDGSGVYYQLEELRSKTAKESVGLPAEWDILIMDTLQIASSRPAQGGYLAKVNGSSQWEVIDVPFPAFDHLYEPGNEYVVYAARWKDTQAPEGYFLKRVLSKTAVNSGAEQ